MESQIIPAGSTPCLDLFPKSPGKEDANGRYLEPLLVYPVSGLLPFGSIFIEMYFIFTSFWNYKYYYVYGTIAY